MAFAQRSLIAGWGINDSPTPVATEVPKWQCVFYTRWTAMLYRVFKKSDITRRRSYAETDIDESFKYFMDFKNWAEQLGLSETNRDLIHLDKDILVMGNNTYGKDKCAFVTKKVNKLLMTSAGNRGKYLLGVTYESRGNKYVASYHNDGLTTNIGTFKTELEAHKAWQLSKAKYIEDSIANYEQESEEIGLVYRPDIVEALLKRSELLRNSAESGIIIDSL